MGLDATIDLELSSAMLALDDARRNQIPFATALALTKTAQSAQKRIRRELPERFTIRNRFLERNVRIQAATKRRPEAAILWKPPASRSSFSKALALQETGGTRKPKGRTIALPRGVKRGKGGTIGKAQRPARVLQRKNVFIQDAKGGAAIFRRVGRGRPRLLYYLTRRPARIDARWEFRETARDEARRVFKREFGRAFARALASRRR